MRRRVTAELPVDTSLFTPIQFQPRAAFTLAMGGWARWLREHWIPFPHLIRDYRIGVVIAGLDLEYTRPFGFFDADTLLATSTLSVRANGGLLFLVTSVAPPEEKEVACITAVLRPVKIGDGLALSATPTNLDSTALAEFVPDEIVPDGSRQRLDAVVAALEAEGDPVAKASRTFTLHRHLCETADQWSGIAIPDVMTDVRESLAVDGGSAIPSVRAALALPLRQVSLEFRRAGFFLDEFTDECRAYAHDGEVTFVHRISSVPGRELMATGVERFAA